MSLYSNQIERAMRNVPGFLGVFAIDEAPRTIPINSGLIINFQTAAQGGDHWVSAVRTPLKIYYSDSFGFPPPSRIAKMLQRTAREAGARQYYYNSYDYQNYESDECGMFSLEFVTKVLKDGMTPEEAIADSFTLHPSSFNENSTLQFYQNASR